jgi:hypothetical protein
MPRRPRLNWLVARGAVLAPLLLACPLKAAEVGDTVRLPARTIAIGSGLDPRLANRLGAPGRHPVPVIVATGRAQLDTGQRATLQEAGCRLRQALGQGAYLATLQRSSDLERLKTLVAWVAPLEPVDHVDADLWIGKVPTWARSEDGRFKVLVTFYEHVPRDEARTILERWAKELSFQDPSEAWAAVIDPEAVKRLAAEEGIDWIEPGPHPMMPLS